MAGQLEKLARGAVSSKTPTHIDALGIPYPRFSPETTLGTQITGLAVRSAMQYKVESSDYTVEIDITRTWEGAKTSAAPSMAAGVSLYHNEWDIEMDSIERGRRQRLWDANLSQLLNNGSTIETKGFQALLNEIEIIQRLCKHLELTGHPE